MNTLPPTRRHAIIVDALVMMVCLLCLCVAPVKTVHGENKTVITRDDLQDQHMVSIDRTLQDMKDDKKAAVVRRDAQVSDLQKQISDLRTDVASYEFLLKGGLGAIGILQGVGLIKKFGTKEK